MKCLSMFCWAGTGLVGDEWSNLMNLNLIELKVINRFGSLAEVQNSKERQD